MVDLNSYFNKINYFIATSDEMVGIDANYDYVNDNFSDSLKRNRTNITYYDIVKENHYFDGSLISRALISEKQVQEIKEKGGMRKYFNIPDEIKLMGDCGPSSYFTEKDPTCTIDEVLDFYEDMDLDFGISLDHVVDMIDLTNRIKPTETHVYRRKLSTDNAIKMLELVKKRKSKVYLIGSVQGWNMDSYKQSLEELGEAGFKYCGIGGLTVNAKNNDLVTTLLSYLKPTVDKYNIKLHLLGFGRMNLLSAIHKLNIVCSMDNSTPLLNASNAPIASYFVNERNNFFKYGSLYIPILSKGAPTLNKKIEIKNKQNSDKIVEKIDNESKKILLKLFEYDKLENADYKIISNKSLLNEIITDIRHFEVMYRKYSNSDFNDMKRYIEEIKYTLMSKPWKRCDCPLCQYYGINMVVFRSQMRNKLRGIHNLKHYYEYIQNQISKKSKMNFFIER